MDILTEGTKVEPMVFRTSFVDRRFEVCHVPAFAVFCLDILET